MCSTKRVQLVVLFLIATAFLAGASAHAGKDYWIPLTSTGAEALASGEYCVVRTHRSGPYLYGDVTARCAGLEPGATYHVTLWFVDQWGFTGGLFPLRGESLTANTRGGGKVTIKDVELYPLSLQYIDVSNANGDVILTNRY